MSSTALVHAAAGFVILWAAACGTDPPPAGAEGSTGTTAAADETTLSECQPPTLPGGRSHCFGDETSTSTTSPPVGSSSDDGTGTTAATPDLPEEPPPFPTEFDCDDVPDTFVSYEMIPGARGYHGVAISPDGLAIGSDGFSLLESTYDGMVSVLVPGLGQGQQMDWLADGDLAHATDDFAITRIRSDGTTEVIRGGVGAYGVTVGPDQQIYVASNFGPNTISRIDPDTGDIELLLNGNDDVVHSLGFSPDGQRLYVGTVGDSVVYYVDLDVDMNPTSELLVFSTQIGGGWHDAIAVDICGYLYVPDFWSSNMYRIAPNGDAILFWTPPSDNNYAHGLVWGTGEHGWRLDALYFPQPYNNNAVGEIVVGVPPRHWDGTVLNVPDPL